MCLISIIVPVYNTPEYKLRRCINSILSQKTTNWECIIVNDGSTDNSEYIWEELSEIDSRVRVIHKKNGGVSSARNAGIEAANGKWITFIDSDDYINSSYITPLVDLARMKPYVDLIVTGYETINGLLDYKKKFEDAIYTDKDSIKQFLIKDARNMSSFNPWMNRIYNRAIIKQHKIRFDEQLSISEDRLFCYQYLVHSSGILTSSKANYLIDVSNIDSLSKKAHSYQYLSYRYSKLSQAIKDIIDFYNLKEKEILPFAIYDWGIYKSAILGAMESNNIIEASKKQCHLYKESFNAALYNSIKHKCYNFIDTKEDRLIFDGHFILLNLYIRLRHFLYR